MTDQVGYPGEQVMVCTVHYVSRRIFSIVNNFRRREWNTCFNNKKASDCNSSSLHHPFTLSTTTHSQHGPQP